MKALLLAFGLTWTAVSPPSTLIYHGSASHRIVALTFDAGADRGYAARILSTLERSHIHASFGMTGRWAVANPDLVRRMSRDHDLIFNHTYDHQSFTGFSTQTGPLTEQQRTEEITQTDRIIRRLTGHGTKPFFRPPYGDLDAATLLLARRLGYRYTVMWSVDSLGWTHLPAAHILNLCLTKVRPGGIILMHVGAQSQDAFALPSLVRALKREGYRFATVARLIAGH